MATYVGLPPGSVAQYAGSVAPTGWLVCDGSAVSRSTYADLFAAIGTAYGVGDGASTFNLPDGRGRHLVGQGSHTEVDTLGDNEGASLSARRQSHKHSTVVSINDPGHNHGGNTGISSIGVWTQNGTQSPSVVVGGQGISTAHTHSIAASSTGIGVGVTVGPQTGNEPTETGAFLVVRHIIKF